MIHCQNLHTAVSSRTEQHEAEEGLGFSQWSLREGQVIVNALNLILFILFIISIVLMINEVLTERIKTNLQSIPREALTKVTDFIAVLGRIEICVELTEYTFWALS